MGIQAIKGVEVGDGFLTAARRGPPHTTRSSRKLTAGSSAPATAPAVSKGGMSIGDVLRVRAAMKPIATVPRALKTIDISTGEAAKAHHQRSDVCAVPAAGVVAEAMVALVLAEAVTEKFGGDSVAETARNIRGYLESIPASLDTIGL
jgi:chorismate synthase